MSTRSRRAKTRCVLSRVFLLALLAAFEASAEEDIKVSQLKVGDSDVPMNMVEGVVDAPPADVWAIVSRCADFAKNMPRIVKSTELSREGDEKVLWTNKCEVTADLPFPLSDLTGITQATNKVEAGVKYSREWTLISGDYHVNQGSWTLLAIDDGKKTFATYKIRVKPKISLPTSWMASAQKSTLKDVILRVREAVKRAK